MDIPSVKKRQPLAAVEVAQAPIQLQPALSDRHGGDIRGSTLGINLADPFARAIEALRPGIRGRELKSMGEAPVQARLQRMVRRIALAGPNCPPPKIRVQAQAAWLERIEIGTRSQSVAFRPDVGDIHQNSAENGHPQLPLETNRPAFGVRVAEILLERAVRVSPEGSAGAAWRLEAGQTSLDHPAPAPA